MRRPLLVLAFLLAGVARAHANATTSAQADAWDVHDPQSGSGNLDARASKTGGTGTASAEATAGFGTLAGRATKTGCVIAFPPFQQICNNASVQSSYADIIHVESDAPDGSPVQVHATYTTAGHISGMGVYGYDAFALVDVALLQGPNANSGGIDFPVDMPLSSAESTDITAATGRPFSVQGGLTLGDGTRDCDGGGDNCAPSETSWSMTIDLADALTLSIPVLPAGATYVHLVSDSGHDYTSSPTAVGPPLARLEGLSLARPNPARGDCEVDLTLVRARRVNVAVFDLAGRRVDTLVDGVLEPGVHPLTWNGRDAVGVRVHGGEYFVRARGDGLDATRPVLRID